MVRQRQRVQTSTGMRSITFLPFNYP